VSELSKLIIIMFVFLYIAGMIGLVIIDQTQQHEIELGDYLVIWLNTSDRFNKLEVTGRIIDKDKFLVKIEDRGYVDTEFS
jgi:hypothetical protein